MNPVSSKIHPHMEEPGIWVGGEGVVGAQAERHVRRRERRVEGLFTTIITLTFIGGLALGGALGRLWRTKVK